MITSEIYILIEYVHIDDYEAANSRGRIRLEHTR